MVNNQSGTRKQHYVPQVYLKNFSDDGKTLFYYDVLKNESSNIEKYNIYKEQANYLLNNNSLFNELQNVDINKFDKIRTYISPLNKIKEKINCYNGTTNDILSNNEQELLNDFNSIDCLKELKEIVKKYSNEQNELVLYLECIQLVEIFKDENYKKYVKRSEYIIENKFIAPLYFTIL